MCFFLFFFFFFSFFLLPSFCRVCRPGFFSDGKKKREEKEESYEKQELRTERGHSCLC